MRARSASVDECDEIVIVLRVSDWSGGKREAAPSLPFYAVD